MPLKDWNLPATWDAAYSIVAPPSATDRGLVTRPIPSGCQTVNRVSQGP